MAVLGTKFFARVGQERRLTRQKMKECGSHGINIGPRIDASTGP